MRDYKTHDSIYGAPVVSCAYVVLDNETGESYVGCTTDLQRRWSAHRKEKTAALELLSRDTAVLKYIECSKEEARRLEKLIYKELENPINKYVPRDIPVNGDKNSYNRERYHQIINEI